MRYIPAYKHAHSQQVYTWGRKLIYKKQGTGTYQKCVSSLYIGETQLAVYLVP